jgi:dTDP-4-amino-4,6-dideoxygalactose transaminase
VNKKHPKTRLEDLALFGGPPAFDENLHVGRPNIGDQQRLLERVTDILDTGWLTNNGPFVQELEKRVAEIVGVEHCVATCNATVALEITIRAIGLAREVIIPAFTFVATAHALRWQGINPVFCDVDPRTYNIDLNRVEQAISPRTTGIIGVHVWGRPCDAEGLAMIAHRHDLKLLFDAAHAFGCSAKGRMVGSLGNAEVFSFHATKVLNTFEGGAVVTNDADLANKIRLMRNFGFVDYDTVTYIGTNGKMSEVAAAMGLTSLDSMETFLSGNLRNYRRYQHHIADLHGVDLIAYDETQKCNYQYIVLEINEDVTKISRDDLQQLLWAENVLARRYFYPGCHRMEPYSSEFPYTSLSVPNTERLVKRVLSLPTGMSVTTDTIDRICHIIRLAVTRGSEVKKRLASSVAEERAHYGEMEATADLGNRVQAGRE